MTELLSPGTAFAGLYGPISLAAGTPLNALGSTSVTVYESDGSTNATLYTDETKATTTSNVITTNAYGAVSFYADPGIYVLSFLVGGTPTTLTVTVNPWYADGAWNVVVDTGSESPLSGDCRLVNATSGNLTETIANLDIGARYKVAKTDSSGHTVEVTLSSGVILGPGLGTGSASIYLYNQGDSVELFADGTNAHALPSYVGPVGTKGQALISNGTDPPTFQTAIPILNEAGTVCYMQAGAAGIAFTGGGPTSGTLTLPEAFPNAMDSIVVSADGLFAGQLETVAASIVDSQHATIYTNTGGTFVVYYMAIGH